MADLEKKVLIDEENQLLLGSREGTNVDVPISSSRRIRLIAVFCASAFAGFCAVNMVAGVALGKVGLPSSFDFLDKAPANKIPDTAVIPADLVDDGEADETWNFFGPPPVAGGGIHSDVRGSYASALAMENDDHPVKSITASNPTGSSGAFFFDNSSPMTQNLQSHKQRPMATGTYVEKPGETSPMADLAEKSADKAAEKFEDASAAQALQVAESEQEKQSNGSSESDEAKTSAADEAKAETDADAKTDESTSEKDSSEAEAEKEDTSSEKPADEKSEGDAEKES
eukprot:CAMPEP_0113944766 /NCGR_PEP_ID=MMETSP1339-20121228/36602_1 /TAXON_ID=94617 /ORGANISM="Fibrocapsa japonica" /LENGTH=284 /DNA_ID=CAMNT_0000950079 /DNA_START=142 /DNA_END=996 /DNA_ORIENTATION=+ /assembly_acc=CAM_ASM_000762